MESITLAGKMNAFGKLNALLLQAPLAQHETSDLSNASKVQFNANEKQLWKQAA